VPIVTERYNLDMHLVSAVCEFSELDIPISVLNITVEKLGISSVESTVCAEAVSVTR
jgi:hypothetical protein